MVGVLVGLFGCCGTLSAMSVTPRVQKFNPNIIEPSKKTLDEIEARYKTLKQQLADINQQLKEQKKALAASHAKEHEVVGEYKKMLDGLIEKIEQLK